MSFSNSPLSSSQPIKNLAAEDLDSEFSAYEDFEGSELEGMEESDNSVFDWDQQGDSLSGRVAPSADSLRQQIADLKKQLTGDRDLSPVERQQLADELRGIEGLINRSRGFVSATTQQQLLSDAAHRLSAVEAKTLGVAADAAGLDGESDLDGDTLGEGAFSKSVTDLASQLRIDPETLADAAHEAGLDLDHLPQTPDESVVNFLNGLGIPSADDMAEYLSLRDQRKTEIANLNAKADLENTSWRADSENVPSVQTWRDLYKYFKKEDSYSVQMHSLVERMGNSLQGALSALGYQASGAAEGRITVGGEELDFISEDVGSYKLDSIFNELTDPSFSPAPRNTEAEDFYSDEAGRFWTAVGHKSSNQDAKGSGYPVTSFTSG